MTARRSRSSTDASCSSRDCASCGLGRAGEPVGGSCRRRSAFSSRVRELTHGQGSALLCTVAREIRSSTARRSCLRLAMNFRPRIAPVSVATVMRRAPDIRRWTKARGPRGSSHRDMFSIEADPGETGRHPHRTLATFLLAACTVMQRTYVPQRTQITAVPSLKAAV